jgi:hypothetical protein
VKFKLHDKVAALEKLGRHLGMFKEKVEITGKDGGPVELSDAKATLLRGLVPNPPRSGADTPDK